MAHDVFISYSSRDKPVADAICARLEAAKIRCWIAPRDVLPGVDKFITVQIGFKFWCEEGSEPRTDFFLLAL